MGALAAQVNAHGVRMRRADQSAAEAPAVRRPHLRTSSLTIGPRRPVLRASAEENPLQSRSMAHSRNSSRRSSSRTTRALECPSAERRAAAMIAARSACGAPRKSSGANDFGAFALKLLRIGAVGPSLALHLFDRGGAHVRARVLREGLRDVRIVAGDERFGDAGGKFAPGPQGLPPCRDRR